ncbi:unnamed protein product [Larinioides sclopetarius]|uniref:Uncharacterized protein n=1 Tax=Larinioides sclopetarius TaxID=280406 RepID=A0AAV1ZNL5_9ARAC
MRVHSTFCNIKKFNKALIRVTGFGSMSYLHAWPITQVGFCAWESQIKLQVRLWKKEGKDFSLEKKLHEINFKFPLHLLCEQINV